MNNKFLLLFLLYTLSLNSEAKTLYFSCETLTLSKNKIEVQTFQKNERVIGLEFNRNENKVVFDGKVMKYIEDYNNDNIYELQYRQSSAYTDIYFHRITGRLDETIVLTKQNGDIVVIYDYEYKCYRKEPLFDR